MSTLLTIKASNVPSILIVLGFISFCIALIHIEFFYVTDSSRFLLFSLGIIMMTVGVVFHYVWLELMFQRYGRGRC